MGKAGAPTKYKEEYSRQVKKLCLLGATDKDIADFFDVSEATINNWKHDYPEFLESIKESKRLSDQEIVKSLHKRAKGFRLKEQKLIYNNGEQEIIELEKEVPPDPTSMIFWLKNRMPAEWRDKQIIESKNIHTFQEMSDEELDDEISKLDS